MTIGIPSGRQLCSLPDFHDRDRKGGFTMQKMLSNKKYIILFVLPGLVIYLAMFIFPIIYTAGLSFTDWEGIGAKEFVGLENYIKLISSDSVFHTGVKNTLVILVVAVIGQLLPAMLFAVLLWKFTKGTRFFRNAYFIPVILSTAAISLLWQKIYDPNYGVLNDILTRLGMSGLCRGWLTEEKTALIAVIIPIIWQYIGYHLIIIYAGLKGIPEQYEEAAKIDGASGFKAFFYVTLPLLRDIIKICVVLATVGGLKIFDNIYIMTGGGPYNLTTTIAIQMYKESFLKMQFGYGSAIAVLLSVICIAAFLIINKVMTKEAVEY